MMGASISQCGIESSSYLNSNNKRKHVNESNPNYIFCFISSQCVCAREREELSAYTVTLLYIFTSQCDYEVLLKEASVSHNT